jgi:diguanylate cyclase (GGDEF)-like protein
MAFQEEGLEISDHTGEDGEQSLPSLTEQARALLDRDPAGACVLAERARARARAADDQRALARNLCTLGSARIANRDYVAAEADLREALQRATALGDTGLRIDVLRGLLRCSLVAGDQPRALVHGLEALHLCAVIDDRRCTALVHTDLGLLYGRLGDFARALEHLLSGLKLLRELGEQNLGGPLNNIGNVYLEHGDAAQALGFFRSAHEAFQLHLPGRGEAIALGNVGRAHAALGDHAASRDALERSLRGYEALGDVAYAAPAWARLAAAHAQIGDDDRANECYARALEVLDQDPRREFADEVLLAAGRFHLSRSDAATAVRLLQHGLALLPADETSRRVADLHEALACAHEALDDAAGALRHFREFHRVRRAAEDAAVTVRIRGMMLEFDVERARQQEEIYRLKYVELAEANAELRRLHEELEARNQELQQLSVEDPLTGLHNRRYLDAQLEHEVGRAHRRHRPLSLTICDLDHFKQINDTLSHAVGDDVLRVVGQLFRDTIRKEDVVARYGGEEFVLILPETDLEGARVLAERLQHALAVHPWSEIHPDLVVTLSLGLAELGGSMQPEELMAAADARLYEAKRSGRNRLCW